MHCTDKVPETQLNHLASLPKWLSVPLQTKWLGVRVPLTSEKVYTTLNYIKHFLISAFIITGCISIFVFASLLDIPI